MADFGKEVEAFVDDSLSGAEKVSRATFIQAATEVIKRTPVKTGRARGNWFTDINRLPNSTTTLPDPSGARSLRGVIQRAKKFKFGQLLSLVNNLPYIIPLEDGSSAQNRAGMVKVTFARIVSILDKEVKKLR